MSIVDDLVVCCDAEFKGSTVDIACDLIVGCNIFMQDTNSPIGNIFKDGTRFIHNFGTDNTFVGKEAGNFTMTGDSNNGFGVRALKSNTIGDNNTALGFTSLLANTTGNDNVAVGDDALRSSRGNRNIGVEKEAGMSLTGGNDNIYIGSDSGTTVESYQIRIGTSQTDCYIQGIFGTTIDSLTDLPVFVDSTGKLGTATSSKQYKSNIIDRGSTSDGLMNLRPVTFNYNHDSSNKQHYGLIAEEVEELFPELVSYDNDGKPYSVRYHELPAMLLNELQKHGFKMENNDIKTESNSVEIQKSNTKIKELEAIIKSLLARIVVLEKTNESISKG